MAAPEIQLRIDYFHGASDDDLERMGVDRALLPAPDVWRAGCEADLARPPAERTAYLLVWDLDGEPVGFSGFDRILVGESGFLHLHVLDPDRRAAGLGTEFVRLSLRHYFETFALQRIYCEPRAINTAPHRTLQRVGFRFLFSHLTVPGAINFEQVTTRWVFEGPSP